MPCSDGGGPSYANDRDLNLVSAVLCGVIRHLTRGHTNPFKWADSINWKEVGFSKEEALMWWAKHMDIDAKREGHLNICIWTPVLDTDIYSRVCSGKIRVTKKWMIGHQGKCQACGKPVVIGDKK